MDTVPHLAPAAQPEVPASRAARRWTLALGVGVLALVGATSWVRFNVSPSLPYGLYLVTAVPSPVRPGALVLLPVPARLRAWWPALSVLLLKPVAAIAGDEVCVEQGWLRIGGDWLGPVLTEAHGMALPQVTGCQVVPDGEVFLASDAHNSLDSRYFGPVPIAALTAGAVPLLTWR